MWSSGKAGGLVNAFREVLKMRFSVVGVVQNMGGLGACMLGSFKSACFSFVGSSTMVGGRQMHFGKLSKCIVHVCGVVQNVGHRGPGKCTLGRSHNAWWCLQMCGCMEDHSNSEGLVTSKCTLFGRA